jgi:TolA-binding protein
MMRNVTDRLQRLVVLGATTAGVLFSLPVLAEPAPSPTTNSAEAAESLDPTSEEDTQRADFTADELEQFANVIPELQTIQESAQAEVIAVVEESGLSPERFNEIAEAQSAPPETEEVTVTREEQAAFEAVASEIQQIETNFLTQREALLQAEGLTVERYQELLAAVQDDPVLLEQIQEML